MVWDLEEETCHLTHWSQFLRAETQRPLLKELDLAAMGWFQLVYQVAWTTLIYSDMEMILNYSFFFFFFRKKLESTKSLRCVFFFL